MKKHLPKLISSVLLIYLIISYVFAGEAVAFKSKTWEEELTRIGEKKTAFYNLPDPLEVEIPAAEGILLSGWMFIPKETSNCGVIILHGHTSSRLSMLKFTPYFWKQNCALLLYDHRHHGKSTGKFGTFGYHEKQDLQKAIEFFQKQTNLPLEKIGLFGESYGAATILQYAGHSGSKLLFVVADSSYKDMESIIRKRAEELYGSIVSLFIPTAIWIAETRASFSIKEVSPVNLAKGIQTPTLLLHSISDEFTPYSHSEEILKNIPNGLGILLPMDWGSLHGKSMNDNREKYEKLLDTFFMDIQKIQNSEVLQ